MKTVLALVVALAFFLTPAHSQIVAGHVLTTGQTILGVTGSAPVANTITGTSNQISVSQAADGGNLVFGFPASVHMTNLVVSGTLSPYSTGTFTADDVAVNYGVLASTGVFTGAVSAASYGAVSGTSGAFSTTLTTLGASYFGAVSGTVSKSTIAANGVATFGVSVTAPAISGTTSITGGDISGAALTATGAVSLSTTTFTGGTVLFRRTTAQLRLITPSVDEVFVCSDCVVPGSRVVIGTIAALSGFGVFSSTGTSPW